MNYGGIIIVGVFGFFLGLIFTYLLIPILKHKQLGQNIRTEGPKAHLSKAGTPSMGGIAIIFSVLFACGIGGHFNKQTIIIAIGFMVYGAIGFMDDYLKVIKKQNEGLKAWQKFSMQLIFAIAFAVYMANYSGLGTDVYIPFIKETVDFGILYIPFVVFTLLAMTNGVNLTDGLDGLAAGVTAIVALYMGVQCVRIGDVATGTVFTAMTGACLGFLVLNKNPAKVFMGDTGSLALGGGLAVAAFAVKLELLLPIVGIIYVLEALSVVLQVGYFKMTGGKRLFKMAPLHHHFEESGMKETAVVTMFWGITLVCCLIAILA
ncbi:MAG: phospho-N-acetylmuramoyl-pentapeptide-transferase [Anaerovoracaceae bacterium]